MTYAIREALTDNRKSSEFLQELEEKYPDAHWDDDGHWVSGSIARADCDGIDYVVHDGHGLNAAVVVTGYKTLAHGRIYGSWFYNKNLLVLFDELRRTDMWPRIVAIAVGAEKP